MLWAPGLKGYDITDYHIDALARFVAPGRVVIQIGAEPDESDPWSRAALETRRMLQSAVDAQGRALRLTIMPEPEIIRVRSPGFVASYVNYYVCNGAVIVSAFGDPQTDARAADILAALYPGREVVSLDTDAIGEAGGGIHCATREQPKTP